MKDFIRRIIHRNPFLWHKFNNIRGRKQLRDWIIKGKPSPPPSMVKQIVLRSYAERYNLSIFVETGTYYGDMVEAMRNVFRHIYSIELDRYLFEKARERFKDFSNIELIHGDSAIQLGHIMKRINQPTLFWLDGHYSGGITAKGNDETPILEELRHILSAPDIGHVIVIDDARCFGSDPEYPTIDVLYSYVNLMRPHLFFVVKDDSIRITPDNRILE